MRRIVACLFVSVDGVVGEPAEWLAMSEEQAATITARTASFDLILLGRATYEEFASEWPYRSGDLADFINGTRKLVVSTTLEYAGWQNTDLIDGNALIGEELSRLRGAPGRDILVLASATLVQSMLRRAMIDELVLLVEPLIKSRGRRLFDELSTEVPMRQVKCVTLDGGLVSISYGIDSGSARSATQQTRRPLVRAPERTIMHTNPDPMTRELDHRVSDGIDVRLLWNPLTNRVSVTVEDERTGGFFKLDVDPEEALTAFHHPYFYASRGWTHHALAA